jgi:hypothetical protein
MRSWFRAIAQQICRYAITFNCCATYIHICTCHNMTDFAIFSQFYHHQASLNHRGNAFCCFCFCWKYYPLTRPDLANPMLRSGDVTTETSTLKFRTGVNAPSLNFFRRKNCNLTENKANGAQKYLHTKAHFPPQIGQNRDPNIDPKFGTAMWHLFAPRDRLM